MHGLNVRCSRVLAANLFQCLKSAYQVPAFDAGRVRSVIAECLWVQGRHAIWNPKAGAINAGCCVLTEALLPTPRRANSPCTCWPCPIALREHHCQRPSCCPCLRLPTPRRVNCSSHACLVQLPSVIQRPCCCPCLRLPTPRLASCPLLTPA
eukprot:1159174-Pelagomonas_calceolata.AAC.3